MVREDPGKTFVLIQQALDKMKLKPKKLIRETHLVYGKTKTSMIKNRFGENFYVIAKVAGDGSAVDIYYNGREFTGPDTKAFAVPFHKEMNELVSCDPITNVRLVDISDADIEESAHKPVRPDNTPDAVNSVAKEIARLSRLRSEKKISDEEFTRLKNELIDKLYD